MTERILELARGIVGAEGENALLEALCHTAEAAWTARLKDGITAEDCGEAFCCAAAFTAAADYAAGQCSGSVESFTAGEISIKKQSGTSSGGSAALRQTAERLMAPYAVAEGFAFKGVQG